MAQNTETKPLPLGTALTDELYTEVLQALKEENLTEIKQRVDMLHPSDVADLLERLSPNERQIVFGCVDTEHNHEVLVELSPGVQEGILSQLPAEEVASAIEQMDSDDTVDVLQHLDEEFAQEVLESITEEEQELLTWPEDSAGGLMQVEFLALPKSWTVEKVHAYFRESPDDLPDKVRNVFVTTKEGKLLGAISLTRLMHRMPEQTLGQIMRTDPVTILPEASVKDVVSTFEKYDLQSCAVVNEAGIMLGRITVDDVLDVVLEEHDKAVMRSAGLEEGGDLFAPVVDTTRQRFPWLLVNLITAILASLVIGMFSNEIEKLVALAVLMPIVASMGGNAGSQTLTVTVRGLAMKQVTMQNALRLLRKELYVGSFNGFILAMLVGLGTMIVYGDWRLGAVICAATVVNHILAAVAGNLIPLIIEKSGGDPAISSGVLVTTVTDVGGFFAFLGLAAIFLL